MELAKKILGENYKGMQFLTKVHGNLGWLMWKWEHESMDQDMANQMQLNQSDEWQAMIDEFDKDGDGGSIGGNGDSMGGNGVSMGGNGVSMDGNGVSICLVGGVGVWLVIINYNVY